MRLYQQDSYLKTFEGTVLEVRDASRVRLSETLFYPTSGGQPHDTGILGGADVTVVEVADGKVWHHLEGPLPEVGQVVWGVLDWPRRYRHMQRHSAQHLLSQAFLRLDPVFETRAVSLSGPVCTLDLAGTPGTKVVAQAEALALEVMYAGLEIIAFEVSERDLPRYPLRRSPKVSGRVRLVQMGDFELSACGGTHLQRTSEALPLKTLKLERVRREVRVHFMAGWEAQADYGCKHRLVADLAGSFSAQPDDLPARVAGLQAAHVERERELGALKVRLAELLAAELSARSVGGVVQHVLALGEAELLAPLAERLTERGVTALLAAPQGERIQFLFKRPAEGQADMAKALQAALPHVVGRGGGSAARAQGSGPNAAGASSALAAATQELQTSQPRPF